MNCCRPIWDWVLVGFGAGFSVLFDDDFGLGGAAAAERPPPPEPGAEALQVLVEDFEHCSLREKFGLCLFSVLESKIC